MSISNIQQFGFLLVSRLKLGTEIYELRDKIDACKEQLDEDYSGETQVLKMAELG
jgi:hypothetical protein